jgi:DNA polymerase-4
MVMKDISSNYFIPRESSRSHHLKKRVRILPLYSFPHLKEFDYKITEHQNRYFIHLDFDAFYAQVEQRDNPRYRGKPISVGGTDNGRGIVMTASYEARAQGVETGMSVYQARKLCPELISVPCYGPKYEAIVLNIMEMLKTHVPYDYIEQYSVDECFVELSPVAKNYEAAIKEARRIKDHIYEEENLTVSIGLSYNKSYAKLASKLQKPDGFTAIPREDKEKIYKLPVSKLWGIGSRIQKRMWALNIHSIGDLAKANPGALKKEFGINGTVFYKMARGEDTSGIYKRKRAEKSLSHNHTLSRPIYKEHDVLEEARRMGEYICRKLRAGNQTAKMISLTIRFEDLSYQSAKGELPAYTNDDRAIFNLLKKLLSSVENPSKIKRVRMLGISAWELRADLKRENLSLFDDNLHNPFYALDSLKEKYGDKIIRIGVTT